MYILPKYFPHTVPNSPAEFDRSWPEFRSFNHLFSFIHITYTHHISWPPHNVSSLSNPPCPLPLSPAANDRFFSMRWLALTARLRRYLWIPPEIAAELSITSSSTHRPMATSLRRNGDRNFFAVNNVSASTPWNVLSGSLRRLDLALVLVLDAPDPLKFSRSKS